MIDENTTIYFDKIYDDTYKITFDYVNSKCKIYKHFLLYKNINK